MVLPFSDPSSQLARGFVVRVMVPQQKAWQALTCPGLTGSRAHQPRGRGRGVGVMLGRIAGWVFPTLVEAIQQNRWMDSNAYIYDEVLHSLGALS